MLNGTYIAFHVLYFAVSHVMYFFHRITESTIIKCLDLYVKTHFNKLFFPRVSCLFIYFLKWGKRFLLRY